MNIFDQIVVDEYANDTKLGMPSTDPMHRARRLNAMSNMTGGKGFRQPAKEPALRGTTGKTRGQLKREAREAANAKVSEFRERQFRHASSANVEFVTIRAAA